MENYEIVFKSICRLCLSYTDRKKMVPLIDENSPDGLTPHAKAVSTFAHINFTKEDCFPSYMCSKCLYLLKQAIHFKLVTESSDKCLKNLKASVGSDSETLKEKIVEITMLKFYFPNESSKTTRECVQNEENSENSLQHSEVNENMENEHIIHNENQSSSNSVTDDIIEITTPESATQQENIQLPHEDKVGDKLYNFFATYVQKRKEKEDKSIHTKLEKIKTKPDFQCKICNKVLSKEYTYNCHMQSHNGYRYICEHCGKGYAVLQLLDLHRIAKHGTGPYIECSQCPYKAYNNRFLNKHVRIVHAGIRPYQCDTCGKAFLRLHTYKKHLLLHSERKIQCTKCPMKFFTRNSMLNHMNSIHTRTYLYDCTECNKSYACRTHVRRHMIRIHGIPRNMQGKIFVRINNGSIPEKE